MLGIALAMLVYSMLILTKYIQGDENVAGLLIFMCIIPMYVFFKISPMGKTGRGVKRRAFTQVTKEQVLRRQNHTCNMCGLGSQHWDFDHIGSRGDNSASNCQALCLDCHRTKTTREARESKRR